MGYLYIYACIVPLDDGCGVHIAKYWIEYGLRALEQEVKHSTGAYLVYDKPTVADACLIPQLYNARRYDMIELLAFLLIH